MPGDAQLLMLMAGVHLLALACVALLMVPALRDGNWPSNKRSDSDSDEGWGHGPRRPPSRPEPPKGGTPLPDADQSRIRLRDHERLGDRLPHRERRPVREPEREPVRTAASRSRRPSSSH